MLEVDSSVDDAAPEPQLSGAAPLAWGGMAWLGPAVLPAMSLLQHWGFTDQAERWNGRLAMLGFVIALATELLTGQGVLAQLRALWPGP